MKQGTKMPLGQRAASAWCAGKSAAHTASRRRACCTNSSAANVSAIAARPAASGSRRRRASHSNLAARGAAVTAHAPPGAEAGSTGRLRSGRGAPQRWQVDVGADSDEALAEPRRGRARDAAQLLPRLLPRHLARAAAVSWRASQSAPARTWPQARRWSVRQCLHDQNDMRTCCPVPPTACRGGKDRPPLPAGAAQPRSLGCARGCSLLAGPATGWSRGARASPAPPSTASRSSNCCSSASAVLVPTPATPGTLSAASPLSASTSAHCMPSRTRGRALAGLLRAGGPPARGRSTPTVPQRRP